MINLLGARSLNKTIMSNIKNVCNVVRTTVQCFCLQKNEHCT